LKETAGWTFPTGRSEFHDFAELFCENRCRSDFHLSKKNHTQKFVAGDASMHLLVSLKLSKRTISTIL
jgi:hypothetical protein